MSDNIIAVSDLSKKFCRSFKRSLFYGLTDIAKDLTLLSADSQSLREEEFWALDNINFTLDKGESLGLIGQNGSGKTTLLRIINGLVKPSKGRVEINGSIGALIALGTGFNPVLTGRENVRIAGAVLGLTSNEIEDKMDEIVDFSDIGDFIDMPVRNYSSGMLVRLGFSVAIQIRPEILLVDEVLAVGDLAFSIKCQKKITEYRNSGGSMILVSHGLHNIRFHCDRALWIDKSRLMMDGNANEVCNSYEQAVEETDSLANPPHYLTEDFKVESVEHPQEIKSGAPFYFRFKMKSQINYMKPIVCFAINNSRGEPVVTRYNNIDDFCPAFLVGVSTVEIGFSNLDLRSGTYAITLVIGDGDINNQLVHCKNSYSFKITHDSPEFAMLNLEPEWKLLSSDTT